MKLIVTAIDKHPFETQEPVLERIHLRPVVPDNEDGTPGKLPFREAVFVAADSQECRELQPGVEIELQAVKPAPAEQPAQS